MNSQHRKQRQQLRLRHFNYCQKAHYFITICCHQRLHHFGEIDCGQMQRNLTGDIVSMLWNELPNFYPHTELNAFIIMPNHLHAIITLVEANPNQGTSNFSSLALGEVIRGMKARCTLAIRRADCSTQPLWQRNYYEHIIRNNESLHAIQQYIQNNPSAWWQKYGVP